MLLITLNFLTTILASDCHVEVERCLPMPCPEGDKLAYNIHRPRRRSALRPVRAGIFCKASIGVTRRVVTRLGPGFVLVRNNHWQAMLPWISRSVYAGLSFHIYTMGLVIPASQGLCEGGKWLKWDNMEDCWWNTWHLICPHSINFINMIIIIT